MKKRSPWEHLEVLTVLVPGAIGLVILGRTLSAYARRDPIASAIVCMMGVALAAGLLELLLRQRRAALLQHETKSLPATPSEATLDGASPLLSGLLRTRLEQGGALGLGESMAPFLAGLLVMLGLLGTLLGLFETVQGAGDALTTSADVSALRRSLTTPIEGLTRSFGCSAAGISASAMLGLAAALVRRREARALRAIYAYAAGPLRVLSPARRQARALEQLATQGLAFTALEQVGSELSALADKLAAQQESALAGQKAAWAELLSGLRSELGRVAGDAGAALHARVAPLVEESIVRTGALLQEQAGALARATEAQASALAQATTLQAAALARATEEQSAVLVRTTEAQAGALAQATESIAERLTGEASARHEHASALLAEMGRRLEESERERAAAHHAELSALRGLATRTIEEADTRERALEARWSELGRRLDDQMHVLRDAEAARLERLEATTARIGNDLEQLAGRLGEQLARREQSEQAHETQARLSLEQLRASAALLEQGTARHGDAVERLVERLPPLFDEIAAATQKSAQEAIVQLAESTDARLAALSQALGDELTRRAESEQQLTAQTRTIGEQLAQAASLLEANIGRQGSAIEGALTKQGDAIDALIAQVGERFGALGETAQASLVRQSEAIEALIAQVGSRFGELGDSAQAAAQATLECLAESADEQAARFAKLEADLQSARTDHARGLAEQLGAQAERLEQKLAGASAVVQEAAALWKASTVEMQAVAEAFSKSIERQREASDAWLESLGEIEGAVERAGRSAAADALSDQLASTQEVFARQLQFQRELFEQLRTLRTGARSAHGEHDVSV